MAESSMKNKLQEAHLIFLSREQEYFIVVVFLVVATKGNLICSVFPKTGKKKSTSLWLHSILLQGSNILHYSSG